MQLFKLLSQALGFFVAAKLFPSSVFADLALIYSVAAVTLPLVFMGLDYKVFILVSEEKFTPMHFRVYSRTVTILSLVFISVATLFSRELLNLNVIVIILFYSLEIVFTATYNMFALLYLTKKKHFSSALVSTIPPLSRLIAIVTTFALIQDAYSLESLVLTQFIIISFPTVMVLYKLKKLFRASIFSYSPDATSAKSLDGFSFFTTVFFRSVQNDADKVFLARFTTDLIFLSYLIMARVSQIFYLFMTSLYSYWSPYLLSPQVILSEKLEKIHSLRGRFSLISASTCIFGDTLSRFLIPHLFPNYDASLEYSHYFFITLFFSSMTFFNLENLTVLGVNKARAILQSVSGTFQVVGLAVLMYLNAFTVFNILYFSLANYFFTFVLSWLLVKRSINLKRGML